MSRRDRSILVSVVLAMILGVGGSLGVAASCLGRDEAHRDAFPEDRSARSSSGGVPGEEPVGTTEVTSAQLPARAPPANPAPTPAPPARPVETAPAPTTNTTVNVTVTPPASAPSAPVTVTTTTSATASATSAAADGGANVIDAAAPSTPIEGGTSRFRTEAPPYGASAFSPNPEAGAGPFTTEW